MDQAGAALAGMYCVGLNVLDDVVGGSPGAEYGGDAYLGQRLPVGLRHNPAEHDEDIVHALFLEQAHNFGQEFHVRPGEDAEAKHGNILLRGGLHNHLRSLPDAGVDNFHAGIAQGAGNDFGAPIVPVKSGLGDEDADRVG